MKTKLSWLAGILDGEGTITITRQFRKDYKSKSYSYRPEIHITNTSLIMLEEAAKIIEKATSKQIKIYVSSRRNPRIVYRIRLQDKKSCLDLIKLILPYLIAKKQQALLLMDCLQNGISNSEIQASRIRDMNAGK